ncbi:heterodisulfide reductase-related iron-sulfur binding cluster [Minwuia sp.]|uniref:heterodisulfide reductase-related iron-sulfur binding cluster n=1 Tax=Minwuia sp. TaxID=2493630 RepID=UPI003A8F79E0
MSEGGLAAPERLPIDWQNPDFYNADAIDEELRRVFDICHGCRLCFNLCDSFPRLFDLIDESESGELDTVSSEGFKPVVDACTLCDMCFMSTCPYTPPHEFMLDFPHLMLRYRAAEHKAGDTGFWDRQLAKTDRNGKLIGMVAPAANWASKTDNKLTRPILEDIAGIDRNADLPKYHGKSFAAHAAHGPEVNTAAPAAGRKAVFYATCFVNYNNPDIGRAAQAILAANGVETAVDYPECCGMPQLEQGDLDDVARRAKKVASAMKPWIDKGYDVVALVPSCALMLKFEWPLILPDDPEIQRLAEATRDITEYIVEIAKNEGLAAEPKPLDGGVSLHLACHARAQNIGQKAAEMLRLIPDSDIKVIERCSGHGGSWGIKKENFETALKVGKNAFRAAGREDKAYVASECPLAGQHILQGMEMVHEENAETFKAPPKQTHHPVELFARACGLI